MASLADLERDLRRLRNEVSRGMDRAVDRTARKVVAYAKKRSSGRVKSSTLAAEGHPFARRHGSPLRDVSTINVQTGVFRSSWIVVTAPTAGYVRIVRNVASYAEDLERGTRTAFARPLEAHLREYAEAALQLEVQIALRRIEESHHA